MSETASDFIFCTAAAANVSVCLSVCVCYRRDSGSWCVRDGNECAWCATTQQCFAFVDYVPRYPFGGCRHWHDGVSVLRSSDDSSSLSLNIHESTDNCSHWSECRSCLEQFMCGWCSLTHNPTIGLCFHGDFAGNTLL